MEWPEALTLRSVMLVARSLSCSIRDVQCTTQAYMLHARTDRDVCQTLCSIQAAHGCMAQDYSAGRRAAEVFMETTEEHEVLRPIKRAKIHEKSHSHGTRSIAWENWSYRASWRGGHVTKFAMRQQRKDVSPKVQRSSTRTEMLFLWCFSTPY